MPNKSAGVVVISPNELDGNGEITKPGVFIHGMIMNVTTLQRVALLTVLGE